MIEGAWSFILFNAVMIWVMTLPVGYLMGKNSKYFQPWFAIAVNVVLGLIFSIVVAYISFATSGEIGG